MRLAVIGLSALATAVSAQAGEMSADESAVAFEAAGFTRTRGEWRACDDPGTASYTPGQIEQIGDLNQDGRPEAIITEGSIYCYGGDEVGFSLVSQQSDASWKLMLASPGVATVLPTKGAGGWPDIEIGGQGFCFPVQRFTGSEYRIVRLEYQGRPCKLDR